MVTLTAVGPGDGSALVEFLVSSAFPFHVVANHTLRDDWRTGTTTPIGWDDAVSPGL